MTTLELVVFGVPAAKGDATLLAASEQLVGRRRVMTGPLASSGRMDP